MSKKKQKKKARITNRQAKIRQKSKKPNKQTNSKYKKLGEKVEKGFKEMGLYPKKMEFTEPPDGVKMSAVILKLAEPLLKKYGDDDKRIETIVSLTIIEWNRLMFPEDQREKFQDEIIDTFSPPDDDAATVGSLLYISDLIAERKKKYFPNLKKVIVNQELIVSNGNITLNIASAPIGSDIKSE
jgi:hypothetical protein